MLFLLVHRHVRSVRLQKIQQADMYPPRIRRHQGMPFGPLAIRTMSPRAYEPVTLQGDMIFGKALSPRQQSRPRILDWTGRCIESSDLNSFDQWDYRRRDLGVAARMQHHGASYATQTSSLHAGPAQRPPEPAACISLTSAPPNTRTSEDELSSDLSDARIRLNFRDQSERCA